MQQIAYAENGRQRIVQFVGRAGKHLAHGGKLFFLHRIRSL